MVPCGFVNDRTLQLIGPGVLVNPEVLVKEINETGISERFGLDPQCAIIEQKHIDEDSKGYLKEKIGTTGTGTGPCNAERAYRTAQMARDIPILAQYLKDVPTLINEALDSGENVVLEGTQGTYISLFHGGYPYVTSKDVCAAAVCSDVGVGPTRVDEVVLVCKAYVTRVGEGPLEGEISFEEAKKRGWDEYGTVTGRQRRAAPFNYNLAKRAAMINGATQIALTKLDILYPEIAGSEDYLDLPYDAKEFIANIENIVSLPVTLIGTGPGVKELIDRR
jgi:adenylosuccinate synthase